MCVCVCVRGFSMFSHRKVAESSCFFCSVIFLRWWLSFEPNFEAQLALEVPQRAFRPSFSDPSHSRDRRFDLAGSAFDFDRLSAADWCRSFASVRKMTSEARIRREKQKFGRSVFWPNARFYHAFSIVSNRTTHFFPFHPAFFHQ